MKLVYLKGGGDRVTLPHRSAHRQLFRSLKSSLDESYIKGRLVNTPASTNVSCKKGEEPYAGSKRYSISEVLRAHAPHGEFVDIALWSAFLEGGGD